MTIDLIQWAPDYLLGICTRGIYQSRHMLIWILVHQHQFQLRRNRPAVNLSDQHGHIGIDQDPLTVTEGLWKDGRFTPEELAEAMPGTLARDKVRELPPYFPF